LPAPTLVTQFFPIILDRDRTIEGLFLSSLSEISDGVSLPLTSSPSIRDYYASKTYAEFLSKSEVSLRLGHRSETSTEPYIIRMLLEDPKYIAKIAHNAGEEVQLTEAGFEYIKDTADGCSLWRKRTI